MEKGLIFILGMVMFLGFTLAVSNEQNVRANVIAGKFFINGPSSEMIYNQRMVPINVSFSSKVNYFAFADVGERLRKYCRNCETYGFYDLKRKPFDDGEHWVNFYGDFEKGGIYENVHFFVDTMEPRLRKQSPNRGFADGRFSVLFEEANIKSVELHYGNDIKGMSVKVLNHSLDCYPDGNRYTICETSLNLSFYDLEDIIYYFEITDILNQANEIDETEIKVDLSAPVLEELNISTSGWKVDFSMKISEDNFKDVYYKDTSSIFPRWKRLCSRLDENFVCSQGDRFFSFGVHNLSFRIRDLAGNIFIKENVIVNI